MFDWMQSHPFWDAKWHSDLFTMTSRHYISVTRAPKLWPSTAQSSKTRTATMLHIITDSNYIMVIILGPQTLRSGTQGVLLGVRFRLCIMHNTRTRTINDLGHVGHITMLRNIMMNMSLWSRQKCIKPGMTPGSKYILCLKAGVFAPRTWTTRVPWRRRHLCGPGGLACD